MNKWAALFLMCLAFALGLVCRAPADWANVAQEWEPYRLNESQRQWFKSIRTPSGVPCCNISDGHPTQMEHCGDSNPTRTLKPGERNVCEGNRGDAYYIPDPIHLDEPRAWIKIPDEAVVKGATNPIGIATVWYAPQSSDTVYIRCFVPESET